MSAVVGVLVLFEVMSGFAQMGITPLLPELGSAYGLQNSAVNLVHSVQLLGAMAGGVMAAVMAASARAGTGAAGVPGEAAYVGVWLACALCAVVGAATALFARRTETGG